MQTLHSFQPTLRKHVDGSVCLEGTRKLPQGFTACCSRFEAHTSACAYDVRYEWNNQAEHWQVAIPEIAGGGGVAIAYCPHCGTKL